MAGMDGVAIVIFSDLVDSTALLARLGDDRMERVRLAHVEDVAREVKGGGGRVVKTLGDGTMATFESALGALRAAAGIQAAVERLDGAQGKIGIAARVGVAAGEPIADGDDLHGMTVVIASRLCSAAGSGEVLVQGVVESLVASRDGLALEAASEYELKGVPDPVQASRLIWKKLAGSTEAASGFDMKQTPALGKGTSMGDEVLCIGLLGAFSISVGDNVIADEAWRLRKAKTLIKLLALAPEHRLHVEEAAELLWAGRDPDSARNNLHQAIFAARRALDSIGLDGSGYLELREELILLSPEDPVRIDAVAFEELAAVAREQGEPGVYRSALEGFDAELLPADRYEDWSRERRDSLEELRLALEAELAELEEHDEPGAAAGRRPKLPSQLTSFVGRERELAETAALLRDARLLTLTGAGGCGKTRLALQVAGQQAEDFSDGVWPVELAALGEPELVGPAVAQALGTRLASDRAPEVALAAHIGDREQLLLLDNCEHLVGPIAHLAEALLSRCPNLTVLATSREPLRIPGEATWRVPSLSLPRLVPGAPAEESLAAESVRLFATRAAQAAPGFELGADNADAVASLCHRLDGMPLAIELAAAQAAVLTPAQIVERLDDSLDLLSAGARTAMTRQQTLRATLAWSFDLLDASEQVLLRRLAVFAGAFGLEAAEDVCAEDPLRRSEVAALLGRLIDKSLVQVEGGSGDRRYRLLETVRQYAVECLEETGERSALERCHCDWYVELAESDPTPAGDLPARTTLRGLDRERDNLRAALASALVADPQAALRLAVALWRFWLMRGYLAEGYRWLTAALAAAPEPTAVRARALLAACVIGLRRGVHGRIHEFASESVAIFRELEDRAGMFDAVEVSAAYRMIVSPAQDVERLVREHEALVADDLPAERPPMWAAHTRGIAAWFRREYGPAREQLEAALGHAGALATEPRPALWPLSYGFVSVEPETGYPLFLHEDTTIVARCVGGAAAAAHILVNLAAVDRAEADFAHAEELIEESLARFEQLGDQQGEAFALNAFGNLARSGGDFERGRSLLERSLALRQEIGDRRGAGITLSCLAMLLARSGDADGARISAGQSRTWFAENDDLIGLGAAELSLANVALCAGDRADARAHLEAAVSVFGGIGTTHQGGWALAVLAAICAEDGEAAMGRRWLDPASRHFELLECDAGIAYCRNLEAKALQSGC
ncbi:MAG TPA: tetratricopeptide repeat protein [Solirubrobacterales bacterium]|nr:tetratricopeptide repeat protein [Solirubrobacterales bacterium]